MGMRLKTSSEVRNMQGAVEAALTKFGWKGKKVVVDNRGNFPKHVKDSSPTAEGFTTGDGTLYIDAAKHANHADAVFTAFHEAFHRGELSTEAKPYLDALTKARKNKVINDIAESIKANYKSRKGVDIPDSLATREALAEIHAANKTGRWDLLKERHGVDANALEKAATKGVVRDFIAKAKDFFTKKFRGSMSDREINKFVDDIFQKHSESINKSFRDLVPEENVAYSDTGKSADQVYADKRSRLRDLLDNGLVTHREFWERVKELKAEREGGDNLKGVYHHVAPKEVLNEPIMRTNRDGSVTPHNNPNTDYEGRRIIPRHDVDRVMLSLRKWDMINFKQSKKMQWLRKEVFPGKSPRQVMEMVNERRNKEGSIYAAVTHERRDNNPKYVHVGKTERDVAFSDFGRKTNTPQFKQWFGESKVKDAEGEPKIVYHGTGEDFNVFKDEHSGLVTGHMTAPLGHYFAEDRGSAVRYAEKASGGRPADERVIGAYMSMKKPYEMPLKDFMKIDSQEESRALRTKLQKEGYDGIHIPDAGKGQWIAFNSEQIKDIHNSGEFNPHDPDIMHSDFGKEGDPHLEALRDTLRSQLDKGKITRKEFYDRIKAYKARSEPVKTKTQQLNEAIGNKEPILSEKEQKRKESIARLVKLQQAREPGKFAKVAHAYQYFSMLGSVITLPKIFATSISETLLRSLQQSLGFVTNKLFPNISSKALRYRHGSLPFSAEQVEGWKALFNDEAYSEMFHKGTTFIDRKVNDILVDAKNLKTTEPETYKKLELLLKENQVALHNFTGLLSLPGRMHGVLHLAPMLKEYAESIQARTKSVAEDFVKAGKSPNEAAIATNHPLVQLDIQLGAIADGLEAAYRGDNKILTAVNNFLHTWENSASGIEHFGAFMVRLINPFLRVSTNLFSKATSLAAGGLKAGLEYRFAKKIGELSSEQADYIIKNIQLQGIGIASIALGAMLFQNFGGLFEKDKKHSGPREGSITFGGMTVPKLWLEHPMFQLMQLGAMTARGVHDHGAKGGFTSALHGVGDMADLVSITRSSGDLSKGLSSSGGALKYLAQMATSRLIPGFVRNTAEIEDLMHNDPSHPDFMTALWKYTILNQKIVRSSKTAEDIVKKQLPKTSANPNFNIESAPLSEYQ